MVAEAGHRTPHRLGVEQPSALRAGAAGERAVVPEVHAGRVGGRAALQRAAVGRHPLALARLQPASGARDQPDPRIAAAGAVHDRIAHACYPRLPRVGLRRPPAPPSRAGQRGVIHYRHTQVSWPAVVPLAAMILILGRLFAWQLLAVPVVMVIAFTFVILLLFATLTVIVDDTAVQVRFGIGLIRRQVPLSQIRSFSVVRNPWSYGWGIRSIPGG